MQIDTAEIVIGEAGSVDFMQFECVHHLFEKQVLAFPHATALIFENKKLSYMELNQRANQLARYLIKKGVGPETLVGVYLERSPEIIIALLGILKAGGAYVPLDPIYPKERLAFMLQDSMTNILLTQKVLERNFFEFNGTSISLDSEWEKIAHESMKNVESLVQAKNLAYTIYTSGSTGKPKGVQIQHGSVVSFLKSMAKNPGLSKEDIFLSVTIITFDIAAMEIFLPLSVGACIYLVTRQTASDGEKLIQALHDSKATVMQATPATWRLLLESGWHGTKKLKMLCGGEAMTRSLANRLLEHGGDLWNMYGPTETTIWSSVLKVEKGKSPILLGPPIDNTQFHVLDRDFQPVRIGEEGELYIEGMGLARGYLNRPELEAEKFIKSPFSRTASRLYQTGDLVRGFPDGRLEFLGRTDHQVKIRGFRIELGEIESLLSEHPSVVQCAVLAQENEALDEKLLVAYLVCPKGKIPPQPDELRRWLNGKLPLYMIPSVFLIMEALPLLPNGKLDRQSLPPVPAQEENRDQPLHLNATEKSMWQIWKHVMGHLQIGIDDNFFDLGGNSLLAIRLVAEIKKEFNTLVTPSILIERPTIRKLAEIVSNEQILKHFFSNPIVTIQSKGSKPPIFCVPDVSGEALCYRKMSLYMGEDQPVYGMQICSYEVRIPQRSIEELAADLLQALRKFKPKGPYYLMGYSLGAYIAYEMALRLREANEEVPFLCLIDTPAPEAFSSVIRNIEFCWNLYAGLPWKAKFRYIRNALISARRSGMQEIRRAIYNLLPSSELRQTFFSEERKRYLMEENYKMGKARFYPGKLTLFIGEERSLKQKHRVCVDSYLGWGKLAPEIEVFNIHGLHTDVLKDPYALSVARNLIHCLSKE